MGDGSRLAAPRIEEGRTDVTPERWQEVKKVLAAALERAAQDRSVYLDKACSEPALRREVESLLAAHDKGDGSFFERLAAANGEPLKIGDEIGPYEILAWIGAGGMGIVYRARDSRLEREVAIKVLSVGLLADDSARRRFRREALALAKLNQANIAAVYDVGEQGGADYLVMECVPGLSLSEKVKSGALLEKEISSLGSQIAAALEEAHEQGIIHRDLKPANVMVTPKGQAKVLDFGLAKLLLPLSDVATTQSFAESKALVGTLPYMAPEQLQGEPVDTRTDIHALGLVLYEMASGRRLFQQDSVPQLADAILHQPPVTPRAFNARISPELERIILKCLEKEPENRYQSAKELGVDLRRLGAAQTVTVAPAAVSAPARPRHTRWRLLAPAAVLLTAAAVGAYFYFHRAPKLTEKDSIIIADFANLTGDPIFDGTLRQGLSVQLEQTPFLSLVSGDRITQALRLMEKPPDTRLTADVAREVCQRVNASALIQGSIAMLGTQYVLGLDALNCRTGEMLALEQVTADGKEKVLAALGRATSQLRAKLGESAASLQTYDAPLDQTVTTSSLEALQAYTRGNEAVFKGDYTSAISFLHRAVTLDPNFATAYSVLGITYQLTGDSVLGTESLTKAYSLRNRVSEREQFVIASNYTQSVMEDYAEGVRIADQWIKVFPRDAPGHIALYSASYFTGQLDQTLTSAQEVLRLDPTPFAYYQVPRTYIMLGRLDEARATILQAEANHVDSAMFSDLSYFIAFLQNDSAAMDRLVTGTWATASPVEASAVQADTAAYHGQLNRSRQFNERAIASAGHLGGAIYKISGAMIDALLGNAPEAKKALNDVDTSSHGGSLEGTMAITLALAGDIKQTRKLADDLNKRYSEVTYVRFGALPAIHAVLALDRDKPDDAIDALRGISSRELVPAGVTPQFLPFMVPVYVRGQAYLAAHQGSDAAAQFQMILDHPGFVLNSITGALAHLGLGRAYALMGDTAKAKTAYQDFLTLWKDADPDIPILKEAKAEYAKLQ
jgi:eukaryotic-like serine/threonine-protein kinase